MASWIDDFEGNKLNPKWVATRVSTGGQADGVWTREVKDSKVYWKSVNRGTESTYWGENLRLPVNAPGDIIVEAMVRLKSTGAGTLPNLCMGFNEVGASYIQRGVLVYARTADMQKFGINGVFGTPFPSFPSKTYQQVPVTDLVDKFTIRRKNGYLFFYHDNLYVGSYAYAPTITTLDIRSLWYATEILVEYWIDWIKVTPSSVVL